MKLHYSQTEAPSAARAGSFTTLWNYTILKRFRHNHWLSFCFTTLWNYTILKHYGDPIYKKSSFTTLWNYTILKQDYDAKQSSLVLLPYEITLFSN